MQGCRGLASKDTDGPVPPQVSTMTGWLTSFVYDTKINAVIKFNRYEEGKISREILRSDFSGSRGFHEAAEKLFYRDFFDDREITVLVSKEQIKY